MEELKGRSIVVTGGSGALGKAVVDALLSASATVVVPYVVDEEVPSLREHVGDRAPQLHCVRADVGTSEGAAKAVREALASTSRLDGLVHLVGGFWAGGNIVDTPEAEWDRMLHLNLKTLFHCAKAALPTMQTAGFGRIVAVGSRAGLHGTPGIAAYSIAKGAVIHFVEALAAETKDNGICVNAIAPSTIDTPANRAAMPDADPSTWVSPREIAHVVAFLCSPSTSVTSGAVIPVYGRA